MILARLEVHDFRNFAEVELEPGPGVNIIEGRNASGKTSLLEAIHLVTVGRSFLASQPEVLVRHGQKEAVVFARLQDGGEERLGVRRPVRGELEIHINGASADRAVLARRVPSVVITPESHDLLSGGPKERRAFLDWGLFHVEPQFLSAWRAFQKVLRQRNAALAGNVSHTELQIWDNALAETAGMLHALRDAYVHRLQSALTAALTRIGGDVPDIAVRYEQGWAVGIPFEEVIARDRLRDTRDGYTHSGPHRADLRLTVLGRDVSTVLSRGQEKLLVVALKLAQLTDLAAASARSSLVLLDDLPAELDAVHRERLFQALHHLGAQVFVTTTDARLVLAADGGSSTTSMFHVEQGQIRKVV